MSHIMWKHFKKVDEKTVSCNLCHKHIQFQNTLYKKPMPLIATMTRHYRCHRASKNNRTNKVKRPKKRAKKEESHWSTGGNPNTSHTDADTFLKNRRNVPRKNYECKDEPFVQMDRLPAILKRKSSSNDDHYAKITDTILYFMCIHSQSYNIIQCEKFKHLMKELMPHYKIPNEDTIIRILDEKYDKKSEIFKKTLNETLQVTISIDSWSEVASCESYLSVTVHFIASETRKLKSKNIEMIKLSKQHSVNCIVFALKNILQNWCIDTDKVAAVVTNDNSNIVEAAKEIFHQDKHIICFAHIINLVAENFVKNCKNCKSLSNIINKARLVVKFIKSNNDNKLHCCQVNSGESKIKLKNLVLDVNSKWDSMFYMLEGFVELWNDINNVKEGSTPEMPTEAEVIALKDFVDLLKPLAFIARECLTENYIMISKVMPLINCAINKYLNMELKTELSKKLKDSILTDLQRNFEHVEFTDSIAIATILDPRFKNLHFRNKKAENNAKLKLYEMIGKLSHLSHESNTEQKENKYDLWTHHEVLALEHENELSSYLTSNVSSKNDDPLEKWESMKTQYPSLYTIAQKYFSIVGISGSRERLFSKTMIQSRNQLTELKILNRISFLTSTD